MDTIDNALTLYLSGFDSLVASAPLYTFGGVGSANNSMNLVLPDTHSSAFGSLNLFAKGPVSHATNSFLPLHTIGCGTPVSASMTLFLKNVYIDGSMTLHTRGAGMWPGYVPASASLPLVMGRWGEGIGAALPLLCKAEDVGPNAWIPLYVDGVEGTPEGYIPLVIPRAILGQINSYLRLHTISTVGVDANCTLVIPGASLGLHKSLQLICCNLGGRPNAYLSLYTVGVDGLVEGAIPLSIPDVHELIGKSLRLYTHGY